MNKKCAKCKLELDVIAFNRNKSTGDGYHPYCKKCRKPMDRAARERNRNTSFEEKTKNVIDKKCIKCKENKPISAFGKDSVRADGLYIYCKECQRKDVEIRIKQEKPIILTKVCSRCKIEKDRTLFRVDKTKKCGLSSHCNDCKSVSQKAGYQKNKKKIIEKVAAYTKEKLKTSVQFKLQSRLRQRFNAAVKYSVNQNFSNKNFVKPGSAVYDLGCTIEEFKNYIETLWKPGMSWNNWGYGPGTWQLDHIIALCLFDLTTREEYIKACNYTNIQPLWHEEHVIKSSKDRKKKRQSLVYG